MELSSQVPGQTLLLLSWSASETVWIDTSMRICKQKSIWESEAEWAERRWMKRQKNTVNLLKRGCSCTENKAMGTFIVSQYMLKLDQTLQGLPSKHYIKIENDSLVCWLSFNATFCTSAIHQELYVHMAHCSFGTARQVQLFLAEVFSGLRTPWLSGWGKWLRKASWLTPGLDVNWQEK